MWYCRRIALSKPETKLSEDSVGAWPAYRYPVANQGEQAMTADWG
jgi:hypothetical protein